MSIQKLGNCKNEKDGVSLPDRRQFLKIAAAGTLGSAPGILAAPSTEWQPKSTRQTQAKRIEVDFSKVIGEIKPLNGVNGGPLVGKGEFDLSSYFSQAGIRHVRLHDIPVMYDNVVDINYIFPHANADVDDPRSYDFSLTDFYIQSIRSLGAEVTYRLGYRAKGRDVTAKGSASSQDRATWSYPARYKAPPEDYAKWAAICSRIVQHYNQGWADGFHYNIRYWEIWNEPNVSIFWTGTAEEYYRLYEVTAKALKEVDPTIRIGGPAMGDLATSSMDFIDGFLKHCADHESPLDFVSWHIYAKEPHEVVAKAAIVQDALDKYGFSKTENIMDEWNYFLGDWTSVDNNAEYRKWLYNTQLGGPPGAAYVASVLIGLQDSTVTVADFYQGTTRYWGGLFDEFAAPRKPYFTFKAFKSLLDTPDRVFTLGSDDQGFAVVAGLSKDNTEATVLISNFGTSYNRVDIALRGLPWEEGVVYEKYVVDAHHDLDLTMRESVKTAMLDVTEEVETPSVCMIRLRGTGSLGKSRGQ